MEQFEGNQNKNFNADSAFEIDNEKTNHGSGGEDDVLDTEEKFEYSEADLKYHALTDDDVLQMKFDSVEDAHAFYNAYSKAMRFSVQKDVIRTNKANTVVHRKWVCAREGRRAKKHLDRLERKRPPRDETRVGCKAAFRIRYNRSVGKYVMAEFVSKHNHQLAEPHCVPFLQPQRSVSDADKAQTKAMRNVGVKTSQIMDFMIHQSGGNENVGFTEKDLQNHIEADRRAELKDGDAEGALGYLSAKAQADPLFFYKYTVDKENILDKLFWADSRSRLDYGAFGEVLIFDTTYRTNAYEKPFVVLAGVNNHFLTTIFGCALLSDETFETYTWVLETLMEAMDKKRPESVVMDGDRAMRQAIQKVIPGCRHRLCFWNLLRNVETNVHVSQFQKDFKRCRKMKCGKDKFEKEGDKMVKKNNVQHNPWVLDTYRRRVLWAEAYLRGHMFVGASSTQRVEGMNAYFNWFLKTKLRLSEFMAHYDRAIGRIRNREAKAESQTENSDPVLIISLKSLEKHGADLFTRKIFLRFRDEIFNEGKYFVQNGAIIEGGDRHKYCLSMYTMPESTWRVEYYPADGRMKCSCLRYESFGIPSRHMICVIKFNHLMCIPPSCYLQRWTSRARPNHQLLNQTKIDPRLKPTARYGILSSMLNEFSYYASHTDVDFEEARELAVHYMWRMKKLRAMTEDDSTNSGDGRSAAKVFGVGDPNKVKTKGNPGGKSKKPRQCGFCKCPGHTKRTCPKKMSRSRGVGSNSFDCNIRELSVNPAPVEVDDDLTSTSPSFMPKQCKRKSMDPIMAHRVKRQLYANRRSTNMSPLESRDANVRQNGSFTINEVNKEVKYSTQKEWAEGNGWQGNKKLQQRSGDDYEDGEDGDNDYEDGEDGEYDDDYEDGEDGEDGEDDI